MYLSGDTIKLKAVKENSVNFNFLQNQESNSKIGSAVSSVPKRKKEGIA